MLDIKFVRNNPEVVKQNIKNKFQDDKLPLVDEVIELDQRNREIKQEVEALRADKNQISKQIGACMAQGKKEEAEELKKKVQENAERVEALSKEEKEVEAKIKQNMMIIPNIIDPSVPIGKDDSENVEIEKFGEPVVPDYEIPYHTDIMESFNGIDLESVGSRLEIVGIGRFLLRVLYSVLIGPFDVVFHLSVECTVLVRYIGLHINFLNRRYPASVFDGGSFVRDDRERRLFGSYFFQFARRNRAGDENQK